MPATDPTAHEFTRLERQVASTSHDRRAGEGFCAEVLQTMAKRHSNRPMEMAALCIQERAKRLVAQKKAGWARVPREPRKFILVDPKGCVLTGHDGREIGPPVGVNLPPPRNRSASEIHNAYIPLVRRFEGEKSFIYLDKRKKATVGVGH